MFRSVASILPSRDVHCDMVIQMDQHKLVLFLMSQTQASLTRLYGKPSSCLAMIRLLQPVERQIIMNHLWLEGSVPSHVLNSWITKDGRTRFDAALQTLASLHILLSSPGLNKIALAPAFQKNFRLALTGGGAHMSFGVPASEGGFAPVTIEMLDQYAAERWESILHYMVSAGTDQKAAKPTKGILFLLDRSGLMAGPGTPRITSEGFQFLLNSPHEQLWILLLEYLKISEERNLDTIEVIQFLFMLSTMQLGREYSTDHFTPTHQAMLVDLQDYGLVLCRKQYPDRLYPTRLATTLTSSAPNIATTSSSLSSALAQGFIVLETNYRLYAYTDNPLQIAILNLFVNLRGRFSNLVTGAITRESVKKALDNGITANQIISYLVTHAHPQMRKNNPLLPITVQDQIRLWEQEKHRVQILDGYIWKEFTAYTDYELMISHARLLDCVLWDDPKEKRFFVTPEGHASCREYVKRRTGNGQAMGAAD